MTVVIAPNIKKQRIFINKNGEQVTEEELFGGMGNQLGGNRGAEEGEQGEE